MFMERMKAANEMKMFQKAFGYSGKENSNTSSALGDQLNAETGVSSNEKPSQEMNQLTKDWLNKKYPSVMKGRQEEQKMEQKKFEADRAYHTKRSGKFLDKVTEMSEGLRERQTAINSSMAAVQSGQMSPLGGDFWAGVLHAPQLETASGAQLATGAKINLMGSLSRLSGGRPNQFIEKKIDDAFAKAGNTKEAQMAKLLMAKTVMDLDQDYVDIAEKIANEDREKYGFVREDIDSRVKKEMKPISEQRMNELSFALQSNIENDIGESNLSKNATKNVMKGTYLTPEMANILAKKLEAAGETKEDVIKLARKLGYEIPSAELLEKWDI
jgi:hypothetical protein